MADLDALNAAVDALVSVEGSAAAELQTLADEVATLQAGSVTQEQIDSVTTKVAGVAQALTDATNAASGPAPTPAPAPGV